ncbi:hypothetical protein [Ruminococcus flavefaciens]|nr:hypothetical protein [Ruminococcus flavefaciens]
MEGNLHVIMLDNFGTGADDFYFKHYRNTKSWNATPIRPGRKIASKK